MIRSCLDKNSQRLLERKFSRRLQAIEKSGRIRLEVLDAATSLGDLALPGFRLEALKGNRKGQYSIRIDGQRAVSRAASARQPNRGNRQRAAAHYGRHIASASALFWNIRSDVDEPAGEVRPGSRRG